tara:strand:- start:554 stop:1576 length:1023 start_codon:yes stop_codon:yes gene_type:complete
MTGIDPSNPGGNSNESWTGSGGSTVDSSYVITNSTYSITPDAADNDLTIVACLEYATAPSDDAVLLTLANGSHRVDVKSNGTNTGLKIVGATTATFSDLDLSASETDSVPIIIRLTLASSGAVKCYRHEIIENDDAVDDFLSITAVSSSDNTVAWGNTSGNVKWHSVYYSKYGAFSPRELMKSDFAQDIHIRMALGLIDQLKSSNRPYLKTQVDDGNIIFAYDLSTDNVRRLVAPFIHVYIDRIGSPEFDALSGSSITQLYDIDIYVTTKGTNYENAYMLGLNIMGEVFDELYTNTGLSGTTDSLDAHQVKLDTRLDDDDIICTHQLTLTYRRRIKMTRR